MEIAKRTIRQRMLFREAPSRGSLTWASAAGAFALYWIYSLVISPLVVPPSIGGPNLDFGSVGDNPRALTIPKMAEEYLPHVNWAGDAKYQMRSASAIVYAEDWKQVDSDKAVRFKPFAMIWMPKGRKPNETPITVHSDSAYVRFARKFDVSKPDPGRVIGGSLEGKVEIRGPNGMRVRGTNFVFSEKAMRVWSDAKVRFEYGPHKGTAHGLQCELLPVKDRSDPNKLAVGGIEIVRLRKNVVMDLVFQPGSGKANPFATNPKQHNVESTAGKPGKPTLVNIRSDGAFQFGVQTNIAVFEDNVRVVRPTKPGKHDRLFCDILTLVFEEDESKGKRGGRPKPEPNGEQFQTINSKLSFRRLQAQRRGPKNRVILFSESNRLTADMDDLIHDAQSNITVLRDHKDVRVLQETSETHAPQITLFKDKKTSMTSLICDGKGWMRHTDKRTGKVDLTVQWAKRLRKFPDPNSNLDIIDFERDVVLRQPLEQSQLQGQFVRIWMDRRKQKKPQVPVVAGSLREPSADGTRRVAATRTRLRRMLALDRVTMTSAKMRAHTKRLEVWFEQADVNKDHSLPRPTSQPATYILPTQRRRRRTAAFRSSRVPQHSSPHRNRHASGNARFLASVDSSALRPDSRQPPAEKKRLGFGSSKYDGPMDIRADLIRVRVVQNSGRNTQNNGKSEVREIWTLGNVEVRQDRDPGEQPLSIRGGKMHIINRSKDDQLLHVYGKPAHVRDRMTYIKGERIHLDRGRNFSWVDGKGQLQLPVDRTLEGRKLPKPQILDVWWRESMNFDGKTTRFRGKVRTVVEDSRVRCEELDVHLTERVSFIKRTGRKSRTKQRKSPPDARIRTVVCRGNVQFESFEYKKNKLVQIRKGNVKSFTMNQTTGDSEAKGPGWIAVWRRGRGKSSRFGRPATVRSNRGATPSKKPEWEYTKVTFSEKSTGNLQQKFNRFRSHVEVVYGPVKRPSHVVDPDALSKGAGWMRCRDLVVTQQPAVKTRPAYFTLEADGNAELDGSGYHGRADSITYDESRDLYVLRAVGRRNATLWRQLKVGGKLSSAPARRMEFIPSQNRLKLDQTSRLQGSR